MSALQSGAIYATKLITTLGAAAIPALGISITEKITGWYTVNAWFMTLVFSAVIINHCLASYVHLVVKKDWSGRKNVYGLLRKGFAVCMGYILFEMIHEILKDVDFVANYIRVVIQLTVLLWPVHSALKNISIINNGSWPPMKWFKIMENFQKDLDLKHFETTKNEQLYNESPNNYNPADVPASVGMPDPSEVEGSYRYPEDRADVGGYSGDGRYNPGYQGGGEKNGENNP